MNTKHLLCKFEQKATLEITRSLRKGGLEKFSVIRYNQNKRNRGMQGITDLGSFCKWLKEQALGIKFLKKCNFCEVLRKYKRLLRAMKLTPYRHGGHRKYFVLNTT